MIVIADDITGAAEIAGIAFQQGQKVNLVCDTPIVANQMTTVVATDTRSMTEKDAVEETSRIVAGIQDLLVFKKTDSALRGHVVAELSTLMEMTYKRRAVYLPANPSKGRIIKSGTYYINSKPLHETEFSYDPEFPALTSSLRERFPDAETKGIIMPDAESLDDIRRVVELYNDGQTIFAGAADLFSMMPHPTLPLTQKRTNLNLDQTAIILCGSTQSKILNIRIPISSMPKEIYDGNDDIRIWDTSEYDKGHRIILNIPYNHRTGKDVAVHLRSVMSQITKLLIGKHRPDNLIIEGGATAWATLKVLGWNEFSIKQQIAPGVVQMRATNGTLVTLKPGSYPWGELFQSFNE